MEWTAPPQLAQAYEDARTRILVLPRPRSGHLTVSGATRLDLVQRLSTNDLDGIADGELRTTILTTAIGRMVDRVHVVPFGDRLLLTTSPGQETLVLDWLQRHVFFQDDVRLTPSLPAAKEWFLTGPQARELVGRILVNAESPRIGEAAEFSGGLVWATAPPEPTGYRLIAEGLESSQFHELGEEAPALEEAELAYQALRIEAGYPEFGKEFSGADIPLEVGLTYAVSFAKGCYLGQEIIARMESRARIPRRLVGVVLDGPLLAPAEIRRDSGSIGRVTSAAWHPRLGWIGLAVVRSEPAGAMGLTAGESRTVRLTDLPFPQPP